MKSITSIIVVGLALFMASSGNPAVDVARVMIGASTVAKVFVSDERAEEVGSVAALLAFPVAIQVAAVKAWAKDQIQPQS